MAIEYCNMEDITSTPIFLPPEIHLIATTKNSGCQCRRISICSSKTIPPHEEMAKVVLEELMMYMVVGWCTESQSSKRSVPREGILRVNQCQPSGVRRPERHVSPHVAVSHDLRRSKQRKNNHTYGISKRTVECVKEPRIRESMVRLVR